MIVRDLKSQEVNQYRGLLASVASDSSAFFYVTPPEVRQLRFAIGAGVARRGCYLVAVYGDDLIGWIEVVPYPQPMLCHVGSLSMGVRSEFRGRGIGTAMLVESVARAAASGIEIIHLEVFASNIRAIALYRRHGFVVDGIRKRAKRCQKSGRYDDILLMSRIL
jgi:ribosomal protein S18 acetylase RimI-like enzyme